MKNKTLLRANPFTLSALAIGINAASISICIAAPVLNNNIDNVEIVNFNDNLTITQAGSLATIGWDSFNIDAQKTVTFTHENEAKTDFVTINNIGGDDSSKILGNIVSKGTVFLSNPNGFIFGAGSSVNTGSFLATTSSLSLDDDNLTLSSPTEKSISINNGANLSAKNNGYIALISRNISNNGAISIDDNGHIILSTLDEGVITLPGVNIGIDVAGLNERDDGSGTIILGSASNISTTNGSVILSSKDLSSVLESVVNTPTSIKAEDLYINANEMELMGLLNYSSGSVKNLHLNANETLTLSANISGSNLNLNLTANEVVIGSTDSNFVLGSNKLKAINIKTKNEGTTYIFNGIQASDSINIDSLIKYENIKESATDLKFETDTGTSDSSITLLKGFTDISGTNNTGLILETNNLSLDEVSNFNSIELDAANISLGGDITAINTINTPAANNLFLIKDISLIAPSINLDNVKFASLSGNGSTPFTLTLNSLKNASKFNLRNINNNDSIGSNEDLDYIGGIILASRYSQSDNFNSVDSNDILISGNLTTGTFVAGNNSDAFNLRLTDDLSITGLSLFNSQYTSINGDYNFSAIGSDETSQAIVGNIGNTATLNSLSMSQFSSITLNENIRTGNNGLELMADNIWINKVNGTLTLENISNGKTSITGSISSLNTDNANDYSSILIDTFNGDIELGSLLNIKNFDITQVGSANIRLNGDIDVTGDINLVDLGDITVNAETGTGGTAENITFSSNTFNSTDSHLNGYDNTNIIISSKTDAQLGQVSAYDITIIGSNESSKSKTALSNDITAINALNFSNTDISLKDDLTLTGNINFLSIDPSIELDSPEPEITINGSHNLSILSTNEKIFIDNFGEIESLNSLSIEGDAILTFINNPNITEGGRLSLLGNLLFDVGADHEFMSNNGELDFSGTTINGSGKLTFNTGTGDLSLGTIGNDSAIDSLKIESTGKLNLYGDISLVNATYDFSSLSAIQIYKDMEFGSVDAPAMVDFSNATLDGTYSLTLFGSTLKLGTMGSNIALQDLTIYNSGESLELNNNITMVGSADINAVNLTLNNNITTSGLNINIATEGDLTMSQTAVLNADAGNISMSSSAGNISIGSVNALEEVSIDAAGGAIFNSINDYISKNSTSINITSENVTLNGLNQIGFNVKSPIVINVNGSGGIKAESTGSIYIANLNSADVSSRSRVIDSSSGAEAAANDAYSQFNLSSLGLISNLAWQTDEEESIRKIKTPNSAPPIYYSRRGWRLGY